MSIKFVHIFFIAIATLVSFGFGIWCVRTGYSLMMALAGFLVGIGLIVYGIRFFKKIKDLK